MELVVYLQGIGKWARLLILDRFGDRERKGRQE